MIFNGTDDEIAIEVDIFCAYESTSFTIVEVQYGTTDDAVHVYYADCDRIEKLMFREKGIQTLL